MLKSNPNKPCKECGGLGHNAFNCPRKVRRQLQKTTYLKAKKPMKKVGKVGRQTMQVSKEFHEEHPGAQLCFYCLYMGWENWLEVWHAEHTYSKTRHAEFRLDKTKLVISCSWHNEDKGSKDIDEYLEILDERIKETENVHPSQPI